TMILGVGAVVALIGMNLRSRRARAKNGLTLEPIGWFALKTAFMAVLILGIAWLLASYRGTPVVLVILGVLVVAYSAVMANSVFGRHVYAIGGNKRAAKLSGVNVDRVGFLLFVNIGVLSALAGLVF